MKVVVIIIVGSLCQTLFTNRPSKALAMKWTFKEEHALDVRHQEAAKIINKYQVRIPVIVEKAPRCQINNIDKQKFIVPADLTVAQFMYIIRKRIQLEPEKPLFLFVNNALPTTSASMGHVYDEQKDADGFLYVAYCGEKGLGD